eukprot:gnl/TRDRNA2_/TRDRNA2_86248_c0_seq1.p1 gnl/TRDRNA2_/TRDRNA2_86248_c0~~gnl/TRDRNA2_/TRDRNA2_86248_c0_seq1.p1  ORF type:complete len:442 (+),score=88.77 gnl/TRDRNA2_/TRDRNA2_86248_c0_seq1:87-1412(+)
MRNPSQAFAEPLLHRVDRRGYGRKTIAVLCFICAVTMYLLPCFRSWRSSTTPTFFAHVPTYDQELRHSALSLCCACHSCKGCLPVVGISHVQTEAEKGLGAARRLTEAKKEECCAELEQLSLEQDRPVIKTLKEIEDDYLALDRMCEKEMQQIMTKYKEKQKPLFRQRFEALAKAEAGDSAETGTPACKHFWCNALARSRTVPIYPWDEPVLEYIKDISADDFVEDDVNTGFKLTFLFADNPYFSNRELEIEYHNEEVSPYVGSKKVKEIRCSPINWKPGMDVTIETVKSRIKTGPKGKKITKQKVTEEPRESFFRNFFRNMTDGMTIPQDMYESVLAQLEEMGQEEAINDDAIVEMLMDHDYEAAFAIRSRLIPYAARMWTGEIAPEEEEDEDEDEDEEYVDDDGEDDQSEERTEDLGGGEGAASKIYEVEDTEADADTK